MEVGTDLALFASIIWTVWSRGNIIRTSSQLFPVQQIMQEAWFTRTAHLRATPPKPPDRTTSDRRNIRWKLPPWPNLKDNFDGSIFRDEKQAGVGVII